MGIFSECLVAGDICTGLRILIETQRGHVVQQCGNRLLQQLRFLRIQQQAPGLLFFVADHEGVEDAGAKHIRNGIERQVGIPQLDDQKQALDQPEKAHRPVPVHFVPGFLQPEICSERIC